MAITVRQAKNLRPEDMLHHVDINNADGTPSRLKVNGKPKVWKRDPDRVRVPLKHGLYLYGYLVNDDITPGTGFKLNLDEVNLGDGLGGE